MGDLSPHFSRSEFDCHDGQRADPDPQLIAALERLRAIAGGHPIYIVSGYRDAAYNRRVGGARSSLHIVNKAADLHVGAATVTQARKAGFTGVGSCGPWAVHVDVRPIAVPTFVDC